MNKEHTKIIKTRNCTYKTEPRK